MKMPEKLPRTVLDQLGPILQKETNIGKACKATFTAKCDGRFCNILQNKRREKDEKGVNVNLGA